MNQLVIKTDVFKDVCSKILTAVDSTELSVVTETLELVAKGNTLLMSVTNREYFAEVRLEMAEEYDFHATVNASLFLKLVSQITTENIQLTVSGNVLVVKGNGTYKLPLIFDGDELLTLPKIEIENATSVFPIRAEVLNSILTYNSKELSKGVISRPIQKLYYMDEQGAITFTSGACVNSFTLPQPVKVLFNGRLVKLFKLFKEGDVEFTLGFDAISEDIVQTKVKFESDAVTITAILSCDDSLLQSVPVGGIRGRANADYPYSVNVNKDAIIQTINRLTLFNSGKTAMSKPYGKFEFGTDSVTIYDYNKENSEVVNYSSGEVSTPYTAMLNLNDLKTTLETCVESHLCISFGDGSAVVISRGNVKNVIPEVKLV
jgi:hypothetical protein